MAASTARKNLGKLIAAESARAGSKATVGSVGAMQFLPAGAPEIIEEHSETALGSAAMGDPVKKPKPKPASNAKPKSTPNSTLVTGAGKNQGKADKQDAIDPPTPTHAGIFKSHSTGRAGDPDVAYSFNVKIGDRVYVTFSEVGGLSWKAESVPVRVGGNNEYTENMRGPGKFDPLTLKRGFFAASGEFYEMLLASLAGSQPRKGNGRVNLTIEVLDRAYKKIGKYDLSNCFIIEYTGPAFNSMSGSVGFEQIRMAYDKFVYSAC